MTFINEYIPKEDLEKYNFAELNKRKKKGGETSDDWTIDREANVWLRHFYTEYDHTELDGGYTGVTGWDFYWKGTLIFLELKALSFEGERGTPCHQCQKLLSINIPSELESHSDQIIKDFIDAFTAYGGAGMLSDVGYYTSYAFTLEL